MKITEFTANGKGMEMLLHQNAAEHTGCWFCGVLIDNDVYRCKRGYLFVYEQYVNEWSSRHLCKFAAYKDAEAVDALWREWYEREREAMDYEEWANGRSAA